MSHTGLGHDEAMRLVVAPDKFRGTASADEVASAVARTAQHRGWTVTQTPMADGGEGTLDALGGANRRSTVTDPLGDEVQAGWRLDRGTAVIEMAAASGLEVVGGARKNDPLAASTYGTGELISEAIDAGAGRVIVGVGGSATTDGGLGALRAIYPHQRLRGIELIVACDVRTTFVDAASIFGPQKGASVKQIELLERRLERLAQVYRDEHGVDVIALPSSGAAGGLAGGLASVGAELVDGFDLVADELGLYEQIEAADLVITGEGFLDAQSFEGKVVGGVADFAEAAGVPVMAVCGQVYDDVGDRIDHVSLVGSFGEDRAMTDTVAAIEESVGHWLDEFGSPA